MPLARDEEQDHLWEEPMAEGEEAPAPDVQEPSDSKANSLSFFQVCKRMEALWKLRRTPLKKGKPPPKEVDKLKVLLPPKGLDEFTNTTDEGNPHSLFPLLRLLMPEKDSSRSFLMKEVAIMHAYTTAYNLSKTSRDYQALANYRDPHKVGNSSAVGDISVVLQAVLEKRIKYDVSGKIGSDWKVGDVNMYLDELAGLQQKVNAAKLVSRATSGSTNDAKNKRKPSMLVEARAEWVRRLNPSRKAKGMTPLEHKWLVRIILQQMQYGLGWRRVLQWYNPIAPALYDAHTSLRAVCRLVCSQPFEAQGHRNEDNTGAEDSTLASYIAQSRIELTFGNPFKPMLSAKTSFARCLTDISSRHRQFVKQLDETSPVAKSLSFKYPVFSAETKLDGERMLAHISRDGTVRIHSRAGNWYSDLYSPVLAPSIRRAVARHDIDVILDGEVLSWDSGRQETIPFGQNRTVANLRTKWMKKQGLVEARDTDLHADEGDSKTMRMQHMSNALSGPTMELAGEECWLQYIVFDVVYIAGAGSNQLFTNALPRHVGQTIRPGPLTKLDAFERKKLLYALVEPQENVVDIVPTWVIRPNGDRIPGNQYFGPPSGQNGARTYEADSLTWTLAQENRATVEKADSLRKGNLSDEQIASRRALSVNELYTTMVLDQRMEGLIFKDLNTPYCLGDESKSLAYWHKFKPDYYNGSVASDLDLVVIGAYFASGLRNAGRPSSFLCACVDSTDSDVYFPLCKVNAGTMKNSVLENLFQSTGFTKDDSSGFYDRGHMWFVEDGNNIPDFVTQRNLIPDRDSVWKPKKMDYPDMWIHPMDSRILTLNAGEIVASDAFSAGVTLRFPRVTALRNGSDKTLTEIENELDLWNAYKDTLSGRENSNEGIVSQLAVTGNTPMCRFLTEEQFEGSKSTKAKSSRPKKLLQVKTAEKVDEARSAALLGRTFVVLDGTYTVDSTLAHIDDTESVRSSMDVKKFILQHSGKVHISPTQDSMVVGGQPDDAKVVAYVRGIENARIMNEQRNGKATSQRAKRHQEMAHRPGVLRWSFVYDWVQHFIKEGNVLEPSVLDYLLRPGGDMLKEICNEKLRSTSHLARALELIGCEMEKVDASAHPLVIHNENTLTSYQGLVDRSQPMMVYTFYSSIEGDASFNGNKEKLRSVIPLARVMGASFSDHMTGDVTHVLCLLAGTDECEFNPALSSDSFLDKNYGEECLSLLKTQKRSHPLVLISAQWIRKRKWVD